MTVNVISEISVSNLALNRIGSTQTIASFADGSNEANQCARLYPQSRDVMLCDFPLPWAEAYAVLDQVAGPEIDGQVANSQWMRTYRWPPDALKIRRLTIAPIPNTNATPQTTGQFLPPTYGAPWKRAEGQPYPLMYGIGHDATGRLIMTDSVGNGAGVMAVYTAAVEDPTQFSADFADALAWRLAADLAMALAFDNTKRQFAHQEYEKHARTMRATMLNEEQSSIPFVRYQSETIRSRWGG